MTIGTLNTHVVLDQPGRIHCGTEDIVTGNVILTYQKWSPSDVELFGPLEVFVTFHGRAKTKLRIKRGDHTYTYRGRAPLFHVTKRLFSGSFRASPNVPQSFPFSLKFPSAVNTPFPGEWKSDVRFHDQLLPPTMSMHYHGFRHHFDCFNEYRIGCEARMSGIDIKINNMHEDQEPHVLYEQPRIPPHAVQTTQQIVRPEHFVIQNEFLVPEADRAKGFKQKAKAMFKSDFYPQYPFEVVFSAPCHAYIGEKLDFNVQLRLFPERSTAILTPEITLTQFTVTIESFTQVRASKPTLSFSEPESHATEVCFVTTGGPKIPGPFSEANNYQQVVRTAKLIDLPSTFSTITTSRSYSMKVNFVLKGAEKLFTVKREYAIVIHPPIEGGSAIVVNNDPSAGVQGSSMPFLPKYEPQSEPGPSNGLPSSSAALPGYDAPPGYENQTDAPLKTPAIKS